MTWIEDIVENTYRNYKNRKIVLWGKYSVSEKIKNKLKEVYGIDTAFYVDKDVSKIDNKQVFFTGCLKGKADKYYVIVPVAYYQSLKEELIGGGYKKNQDYYYFCDCIVKMTDDYYEDSHGNKIIGSYNKSKFVFSGFNSVVRVGENINFNNSSFYIYNDVEIEIGGNCSVEDSVWHVEQNTSIQIGNKCVIKNGVWNTDRTHINIGDGCAISNGVWNVNSAHIEIGNGCAINGCVWNVNGTYIEIGSMCNIRDNKWTTQSQSHLKLGNGGQYYPGEMWLEENSRIIIGRDFSIRYEYNFSACRYTQIIIGDDVMCSTNVYFLSNDGHSIFDVRTGMNINSTEEISKSRKILIGSHVWIGANSMILYNTEIHDGSIIGAGSLVKSEIPNNCIAAGVPVKVIKKDVAWSRKSCADKVMESEDAYAHLTE